MGSSRRGISGELPDGVRKPIKGAADVVATSTCSGWPTSLEVEGFEPRVEAGEAVIAPSSFLALVGGSRPGTGGAEGGGASLEMETSVTEPTACDGAGVATVQLFSPRDCASA